MSRSVSYQSSFVSSTTVKRCGLTFEATPVDEATPISPRALLPAETKFSTALPSASAALACCSARTQEDGGKEQTDNGSP